MSWPDTVHVGPKTVFANKILTLAPPQRYRLDRCRKNQSTKMRGSDPNLNLGSGLGGRQNVIHTLPHGKSNETNPPLHFPLMDFEDKTLLIQHIKTTRKHIWHTTRGQLATMQAVGLLIFLFHWHTQSVALIPTASTGDVPVTCSSRNSWGVQVGWGQWVHDYCKRLQSRSPGGHSRTPSPIPSLLF
jgi:hypothetical protein